MMIVVPIQASYVDYFQETPNLQTVTRRTGALAEALCEDKDPDFAGAILSGGWQAGRGPQPGGA